MEKLEIIASGAIRLAAANIYGQVPLEINMYRARAYCEAKGKGITAKGTKSNPPTGTGDAGFTINNEFNASAQTCVVYGKQFIQYRPFEDDPEETDDLFELGLIFSCAHVVYNTIFYMLISERFIVLDKFIKNL
ncbi:MAG: hypothetical protein J1F18_02855 [Lachnospiraceae bacterium]|nr:hypothetical protein [Lachnospiraceae bacterium]